MSKTRLVLIVAAAAAALIAGKYFGTSAADIAGGATVLEGMVRSADRDALEGVTVSARADGKTFTTSVFTDAQGQYVFPELAAGHYRIWAQAVGFETAAAEKDASGAARQDFTLADYEEFSRQLTGTEWMAALPEDTPENRRMKMIFRNVCAGCHQPSFVLQNRFDEAGWKKIIDLMEGVGIYGDPPDPKDDPVALIHAFKPELAAYLARMRGPGKSPMQFQPFPRPRGEAARVVITEYDIPNSADLTHPVTHDGSNWMEGVPSAYEARGPHDAEVDASGFVWVADSQNNPQRTLMRLDPQTGEVKNYRLEGRNGNAMRSHGIVIDHKGIAWFNADGGLGKVDTQTGKLEWFDPPKEMARVGGTVDVDNEGFVCASTEKGALRFDPNTNTFTEFASISPGRVGRTYGVAVDAQGNCWWAQMNYDKLGYSDISTGKSLELALDPRPGFKDNLPEKDLKIYETSGLDWNYTPPWQQGPRRLGGDRNPNGSTIWVANWWGDNLAKIDIHTRKVTYYQYPSPGFGGVYDTVIDKNGMVWINLTHADRVARFNPQTEQWTEFPLPTLGTETRFIAVDNSKSPVEVWTPYWRTSKMARIQFRTEDSLQARR